MIEWYHEYEQKSRRKIILLLISSVFVLFLLIGVITFFLLLVRRSDSLFWKILGTIILILLVWVFLYIVVDNFVPEVRHRKRLLLHLNSPKDIYTGVIQSVGASETIEKDIKGKEVVLETIQGTKHLFYEDKFADSVFCEGEKIQVEVGGSLILSYCKK